MVSSDKFPVLYKLGLGKQGAVEKLSNPINIIQCIVEEEGEVRGTTLPEVANIFKNLVNTFSPQTPLTQQSSHTLETDLKLSL